MIRLGLRLTISGGREAVARLTLIAIAVAIGVTLLLTALAGINAVNHQNSRFAWLETAYPGSNAPAAATGSIASADSAASTTSTKVTGSAAARAARAARDPLWWLLRADYYQGRQIARLDVAATGPDSPVPPGLARLPAPGQFYASPALAKLLRDTPDIQLDARFPGRQVGTIGSAALPAPNSLIIVIGGPVAELSHREDARQVFGISTTAPSSCVGECVLGIGINANGITLILSVVVAALLFPVLIFIGGATRLSAARREQRFAAMRLIGATPRQISVLSTVESSVAAVAGVALGFALFFALRPVLATIPFTGSPFFTSDLSLSPANVLLVVLGIPVAAAVAARVALRRVNTSPLGVSRRTTPRPPRAWRVIPLLAGLGELGSFAYVHDIGATSGTGTGTEAIAFLTGVLLVMTGLVIAGPWLTMVGSRLMVWRARRPATLIAARRLADNPQACFRAISGLVLAVFVGTGAVAVITTILAYNGGSTAETSASAATVVDRYWGPHERVRPTTILAGTTARLTSISGVAGVTVVHDGSEHDADRGPFLVACDELRATPALGRCPAGADTVAMDPAFGGGVVDTSSMSGTTWPAADVSATRLRTLPIDTVAVETNGSTVAIERARTILVRDLPRGLPPQTISEIKAYVSRDLDNYRRLAAVVILSSLPIAGCSLAVSVAGGLAERRRPFSLLRLTGAPLGLLRHVIIVETAVPLLVTAAVSVGAGLLCAHLFLRGQLYETLQPPGVGYYLLVVGGLAASLAVIASTLPLLRRITGPESVRNE
ncbi:FtsX-like permease family protein [Frankia gtarii]|uniref:FtsX-like permease family protein n=1 Tax=Frankia gtarii TaxID=2950102 RepID=UPI0021BE307B|nr:FtsX-like permease family protein [Frankia gtarii]